LGKRGEAVSNLTFCWWHGRHWLRQGFRREFRLRIGSWLRNWFMCRLSFWLRYDLWLGICGWSRFWVDHWFRIWFCGSLRLDNRPSLYVRHYASTAGTLSGKMDKIKDTLQLASKDESEIRDEEGGRSWVCECW